MKLVDFSPTRTKNLYNLGFGDLLPDGSLNHTVNSNNGDIIKVLATVVQIVRDFTQQFPEIKIFFSGSTDERTKMYARILRMYYDMFREEFIITAVIKIGEFYDEVAFDSQSNNTYFAFFIKRIN